jgi:uncharacterized membrane protein
MRLFLAFIIVCLMCGAQCQTVPNKPTEVKAGSVSVKHDPNIQDPPKVNSDTTTSIAPIPPGSIVKVTKTDAIPATEDRETIPAQTITTIELPKGLGMEIKTVSEAVSVLGSTGFGPPKPATPTEKANALWVIVGVIMTAAGLFLCTPWGGTNYRVGAIIAAGGVGMAVIGKFIDQIKLPAPAIFSIFVIFALAVYYGYRVRHKQIQTEPTS